MDRFRQLGPAAKKGVPGGFVDYLSMTPEERHVDYRRRVEKMVHEHPTDAAAQLSYLKLSLEDGQVEMAAAAARRLAGLPPSAPLLADAGRALLESRQYRPAMELLQWAVAGGASAQLDPAIAAYIHSFRVGGYDVSRMTPPSILVGDATAGEAAFRTKCASCHFVSGDLKGIASRIADPKTLQNTFLMPGGGGRGGRGGRGASGNVPPTTVAVTLPSGKTVEGRLLRIDDFIVTLADAVTAGEGSTGGGRGFGGFGGFGGAPTIVGGEGAGEMGGGGFGGTNVRSSILEVDGKLYFSTPDNAWAVDARDGHELWHYFWKTKGGTHIGNRGLGMWGNWLYMETPDDYLVCLDARTGKERWHKEMSDFNQQYFSTMAPVAIGNHIVIGTGNDLDEPGYVQARDPETGDVQWTFYTVPMKQGDAGLETLGSLDGARHGAGNVWIPGTYDPETHLYIFGTGSLTSPNNGGATNWPPPAYSPDTGLFYVPTNEAYSMYYLTETDPRGAMGLGGKEEDGLGTLGSYLTAIDYKTGKVAWRHRYPGTSGSIGSGMLTTAGKLLFAGDLGGNLVAYNPADGKILWHSHIGQVSNAPETYQLDGHQYILAAADDSLYAVLIGYLFNLFATSARNLSMNPST